MSYGVKVSDEVLAEEAAADADFKRALESQQAFQKWGRNGRRAMFRTLQPLAMGIYGSGAGAVVAGADATGGHEGQRLGHPGRGDAPQLPGPIPAGRESAR